MYQYIDSKNNYYLFTNVLYSLFAPKWLNREILSFHTEFIKISHLLQNSNLPFHWNRYIHLSAILSTSFCSYLSYKLEIQYSHSL